MSYPTKEELISPTSLSNARQHSTFCPHYWTVLCLSRCCITLKEQSYSDKQKSGRLLCNSSVSQNAYALQTNNFQLSWEGAQKLKTILKTCKTSILLHHAGRWCFTFLYKSSSRAGQFSEGKCSLTRPFRHAIRISDLTDAFVDLIQWNRCCSDRSDKFGKLPSC